MALNDHGLSSIISSTGVKKKVQFENTKDARSKILCGHFKDSFKHRDLCSESLVPWRTPEEFDGVFTGFSVPISPRQQSMVQGAYRKSWGPA